eukprot:CAMPEP_0184711614 /NCGR_PEP_ID=MMETSP0314-20130426/2252_1 /TAXON_ID=38298 /ORGANISM="Rhodella maculata, Strain CCMP 736" /LENGTH=120 /DNA_ID=CAMNT_0027173797 /DNA_START=1051 /DNA_END=1415 /DNA_ORIENTATION=+
MPAGRNAIRSIAPAVKHEDTRRTSEGDLRKTKTKVTTAVTPDKSDKSLHGKRAMRPRVSASDGEQPIASPDVTSDQLCPPSHDDLADDRPPSDMKSRSGRIIRTPQSFGDEFRAMEAELA